MSLSSSRAWKWIEIVSRAWQKLAVGRLRYGRGQGYAADRYWADRFRQHGTSLRGPGHEGRSESENQQEYARAALEFEGACRQSNLDLSGARVLEVGCGTGYYTRLLHGAGVTEYTGLDITDVLFAMLQREFPLFRFVQADICRGPIDGLFDVVVMIDVVEHIVTESDLDQAACNLSTLLKADGVLLLSVPVPSSALTRAFYLRFWPLAAVLSRFPEWHTVANVAFRSGRLLLLRKPPRPIQLSPG
jgi:SAM-dependent methyltransferase